MTGQAIIDYSDAVEIAVAVNFDLAEGPIWDTGTDTLIFVDGIRGHFHRLSPRTGDVRSMDVGETIGAALPTRDGGVVVTTTQGVKRIHHDGAVSLLAPVEPELASNRMNDAKCDSCGRMWSGTFSTSFERGAGSLYRIDPDRSVHRILSGIRVSNGIGWNPDETRMYFVDTLSGGVDMFDYDIVTGTSSNRRRFVSIDRSEGLPDGLTVDTEGAVWVALFHGSEVRRYDAKGRQIGVIRLPAARVTSCNFGGPDLRDLYITTADFKLHDDGMPHESKAGYLFQCRPGVQGLPSHSFGG